MAKRKLEVVIVGNASSLQRAVGQSTTAIGRLNKGVGGALKGALGFAAASAGIAGVGAAITAVATKTIGFDKAMRNVNSIAQLNEKQFGRLEKSVLKLAGKTAQAPETLANGLYDLVSSGFKARDAVTILAASARAATAGLTTTEVSTKAVAAVLNAYHQSAGRAAGISDVLFQTVNRGVITFEDLAQNIGTVLPFAASLGVNLNQVGASISTLTKQGISGELSVTFLKNAMVGFLKPSKDMTAAIKATGYESGEALIKAKGFQGGLDAVRGTTDGSKKALAALFPNIRGLTAALGLTGINARTAHGDLNAFKNTAGATATALSQQSKSISYQWNKVKATFDALAIQLGLKLVPAVTKALAWFERFIAEGRRGQGVAGQLRSAVESLASAYRKVEPGVQVAVKVLGVLARVSATSLAIQFKVMSTIAGVYATVGRAALSMKGSVVAAFNATRNAVLTVVSTMLGILQKFIQGLGTLPKVASKLPIIGKAFKPVAAAAQDAANKVGNLRAQIDQLHDKKITITTQINTARGGGGGAFGLNKPKAGTSSVGRRTTPPIFGLESELSSAQSLRDSTQAGFDAADQAARRAADRRALGSKDKSTRKQAIADLRALNQEVARAKSLGNIDLKISGYEKAIRFKDAISDIRNSIHDLTGPLADKFRAGREKAIGNSPQAQELRDLQAQDKQEQDARTGADLQKALDQAVADGDAEAQRRAQEDIAAFKRSKREEELQAGIDAANANVDNEVAAYQSGLDAQVSALVDSLDQRKIEYSKFVADLAAMGITFTASSDQEQAITLTASTGTPKRTKKVKGKKKHRASGGPVSAFESYIVGEHEPEVFVPDRNGRILNGKQMRGMGWGGDINLAPGGVVKIGSQVDLRREMNRVAFSLST